MCDSTYLAVKQGSLLKDNTIATEDIYVPCGRCPTCKLKRVQHWVFRLKQEDNISTNSHFVTLTYDTRTVPITPKGFMTLKKTDFQNFMKRLRKLQTNKLKYYACGEYGTKNKRPHYHMIIFNLDDPEHIATAWSLGTIHIGNVTGDSIAYTAKYIDKPKQIPQHQNDDRLKEFSLMSKKLGIHYTENAEIKHFHLSDPNNNVFVTTDGQKQSMPRYYREKLYSQKQRKEYASYVKKLKEAEHDEEKRLYEADKDNTISFEAFKDFQKIARFKQFQSRLNQRQ